MDIVKKVHMKRNCEFVPLTLSSPPSRNLNPKPSNPKPFRTDRTDL